MSIFMLFITKGATNFCWPYIFATEAPLLANPLVLGINYIYKMYLLTND